MSRRRIDWANLPPSGLPPRRILAAMAAAVPLTFTLVAVLHALSGLVTP